MFNKIPTKRPDTPLLDTIGSPGELRQCSPEKLETLAVELRHFLLYTVGQTGGHFGAGLGVIELTIVLHYLYETPIDRLIWDVGHQTYPHKILTGRMEEMLSLRQPNGLAPFPSRSESVYDIFGTGHSSTSISAALGFELAAKATGERSRTVVVIGDGAMTAGMAFEALNHVAACQADILIILNDNAMSISENVGGLANYFARNIAAEELTSDDRSQNQNVPGSIFRDLGFSYTGPIDGHDLPLLLDNVGQLKEQTGPRILHVLTTKGKGYAPAEASPVASHALTKLEKQGLPKARSYSNIFGDWLCEQAEADNRLIGITPAMKEGSDLIRFAEEFPDRFHDVAIAEQHAVTLAAGAAAGGAKPVVAIYSTFLQRAYDQLIHDVAIQNLDVLFAVDRASLLEDGPTHSGVFDLSFARAIPNLVIMTPSDGKTLRAMLDFGYERNGPVMVRYPRGTAQSWYDEKPELMFGKGRVIRQGSNAALLVFGPFLKETMTVAENHDYTVVDMHFAKPIDADAVTLAALNHRLLVTLEENVIAGGAGSAVNEIVMAGGLTTPVLNLGVPDDFPLQDEPQQMKDSIGLSIEGIDEAIRLRLEN